MYILENSDLEPLLKSIKELTEEVKQLKLKTLSEKWLNMEETAKLLHVSKRTVQSYRDKGFISFSQIGHVILFNYADIEVFLNNHRFKAFAK